MDIRTGKTYESEEEAAEAGVPKSDLLLLGEALLQGGYAEPEPAKAGEPGEIIRVTKGPFKGRVYRRNELRQLELVRAWKPLHRRKNA